MARVTGVTAKALTLAIAGTLLFGAGCKKDEEVVTETPAPPPLVSASAAALGANPGDVATYPTMAPQRGTRRLLQPFVARQGADATSKDIALLDTGTILTIKATQGTWMLVSWPSKAGQLSLGWVDLKLNDTRAAVVSESTVVDAGAPSDAGTKTTDAGTTVADAGTTVTDAGTTITDAGTKTTDAGTTATVADAGLSIDGGILRKKIILKKP